MDVRFGHCSKSQICNFSFLCVGAGVRGGGGGVLCYYINFQHRRSYVTQDCHGI